jgi:photosystem II stability/assembly factor-like uncharacterized protein
VFKSTNGGDFWSEINHGIIPQYVLSLVIDPITPRTIYVGAAGGMFKSIDAGGSWNPINNGLTSTEIGSLAIDPTNPQIIYVGTSDSGMFKSVDAGNTWNPINNGLTDKSIDTIIIDPTNPQAVYVGTAEGGVFKSADAGGFWTAANNGLTNKSINVLAIAPDTPQTIYAGTWDGVFKSANAGDSWTAINLGLTDRLILSMAIDPNAPKTVFAGTNSDGVFKGTPANIITSFSLPANWNSLTVPITLSADVGGDQASYFVGESAATPKANARGWSLTAPTEYTLSTAGTKTLYAWVKDEAGTISPAKSARTNIDLTPPRLTVNAVAPTRNTTTIISGTKEAGSHIDVSAPDGVTCTFAATTTDASSNWKCTATGFEFSDSTTISFTATDKAGNVTTKDAVVTYDNVLPTGTILIRGMEAIDNYTRIQAVKLELTCGGTGSAPSRMQFSNDSKSWSAWEPFKATKPKWWLSSGIGQKTVYVRFMDAAGNISDPSSDTIWFRTAPP